MLQSIKAFCIRRVMWIFLLIAAGISCWAMLARMKGGEWIYAVYMDGRGYYAQLPAFFIYDDPTYAFYSEECALKPDAPTFLNEVDGKSVNKYFCGEAFLQLPFFTAGHLIAKNSSYKANGYTQPYFYSVAIAAIFYFLLGLFFLWKLLEKFLSRKRVILFVCICFAFGTNLFHYAVHDPSMSHVYSFAAVTGFLYFIRCFFLSPSWKYLLLAAAALGMVALLRPVNIVVFFAFPVMAGEWENVKAGFRWIGKNILPAIFAVLLFLAICFVQLYVYYWHTGHFFVWAYRDEGFDFLHPHFFGTLFSYEKGLFVYTPVLLLAIPGLVMMARKSRYLFFSLLAFLLLIAWIVSSWHEWKYGHSFGLRAYIDYYALLALPLAFFVDFAFARKFILAPLFAVTLFLISLYSIQQYQYNHRILHPGGMDKEAYWLVFMQTDKKYEDTITYIMQSKETDGGFNDMEGSSHNVKDSTTWAGAGTIVEGVAFSGKHSSRIDSANIYSCAFSRTMSDSMIYYHPTRLVISAMVLRNDTSDKAELVVAQVKGDKFYFLEYYPLPPVKTKGKWQEIRREVRIPQGYEDFVVLKVFFMHKNGIVYIDDLRVDVTGR